MAVQQVMGVLPQRRTRFGGRGLAFTACGRTAIKPVTWISHPEAGAFVIWRMAGASGPAILSPDLPDRQSLLREIGKLC
jgi:hypothetical protein